MASTTPEFWSENNLSASGTWGCLRSLKQFPQNFEEARDLRMDQMAYYQKTASPDRQRQLADGMADQLNDMLVFVLGAGYDPGIERNTAVTALSNVFALPEKTLFELAVEVENHFTF